MKDSKIRLDRFLVEKGMVQSRERARSVILSGSVLVNKYPVDKPGTMIALHAAVEIKGEDIPYVSRGGLKLEAALNELHVDVRGAECMDIGASTGGFTDCLLQHGANRVTAVDVGYGQLAWKLRQDPRVTVLERTNIRHLSDSTLDNRFDIITIDVSFISLKIVVPSAIRFLKEKGKMLALIKPQFEVGRGLVGKRGVVRDSSQHHAVIQALSGFFSEIGLCVHHWMPSPILGPKGNREFFIYLSR